MKNVDKYIEILKDWFKKSDLTGIEQNLKNDKWLDSFFAARKTVMENQIEQDNKKKEDDLCDAIAKIEGAVVCAGLPELRGGLDFVQIKPNDDEKAQQVKEILWEHNQDVVDETQDTDEYLIFYQPFDQGE